MKKLLLMMFCLVHAPLWGMTAAQKFAEARRLQAEQFAKMQAELAAQEAQEAKEQKEEKGAAEEDKKLIKERIQKQFPSGKIPVHVRNGQAYELDLSEMADVGTGESFEEIIVAQFAKEEPFLLARFALIQAVREDLEDVFISDEEIKKRSAAIKNENPYMSPKRVRETLDTQLAREKEQRAQARDQWLRNEAIRSVEYAGAHSFNQLFFDYAVEETPKEAEEAEAVAGSYPFTARKLGYPIQGRILLFDGQRWSWAPGLSRDGEFNLPEEKRVVFKSAKDRGTIDYTKPIEYYIFDPKDIAKGFRYFCSYREPGTFFNDDQNSRWYGYPAEYFLNYFAANQNFSDEDYPEMAGSPARRVTEREQKRLTRAQVQALTQDRQLANLRERRELPSRLKQRATKLVAAEDKKRADAEAAEAKKRKDAADAKALASREEKRRIDEREAARRAKADADAKARAKAAVPEQLSEEEQLELAIAMSIADAESSSRRIPTEGEVKVRRGSLSDEPAPRAGNFPTLPTAEAAKYDKLIQPIAGLLDAGKFKEAERALTAIKGEVFLDLPRLRPVFDMVNHLLIGAMMGQQNFKQAFALLNEQLDSDNEQVVAQAAEELAALVAAHPEIVPAAEPKKPGQPKRPTPGQDKEQKDKEQKHVAGQEGNASQSLALLHHHLLALAARVG